MVTHYSNHRLKSGALALLIAVCVIGSPSVAMANAGTPLMWATALHLFIGNACIGILEGVLLSWFFRVPTDRAIMLMILANYFSAWVGLVSLSTHLVKQFEITLYNAQYVVWGMIAIAYLATLILEWPFVLLCFWNAENRVRRSLKASLLVQSISYVLLFGWYAMASVNSVFDGWTIVPPDQIATPSDVRIYYIDDKDGDVSAMELGTRQIRKVFDLNSRNDFDCLSFDNSNSPVGFYEIVALLDAEKATEPKVVDIGITVWDGNCPQDEDVVSSIPNRHSRHPRGGGSPKLGAASLSPWTFRGGFWAAEGLLGKNEKTGDYIQFALETPYVEWSACHVTQLPSDLVLLQFGNRQICILDFNTKKVAVLCFGRGPLAQLEE